MSQTNSLPTSLSSLQDLYGEQFTIAVNQAAATLDRPEVGDRLQKAMDFVLTGAVTLHDDGTATVKSGSHSYHINGACLCQDSEKRSKYCKHFLAVQLFKRTLERLHQPTNGATNQPTPQAPQEPRPEAPQTPQSAAWQVQEAPASCCLKWQIGGLEMMYTMRDVDDEKLFARVGRILPRIEAKLDAQRQERQARQGAKASQQPPAREEQEDDLYCEAHDAPMKRHTKGKQSWVSHQLPDGTWCRGSK